MKKLLIGLAIVMVALIAFWQMGGIDFLLARTIFSPDYSEEVVEEQQNEEVIEDINNDEEEDVILEELEYSSDELEYTLEIIGEDFEIPWEILPLSDDEILITERAGRVILLNSGVIHTQTNVEHTGEAGLLGLEKSIDFEESKKIYLYYTYRDGNNLYNRVSKFIYNGKSLKNEEYVLDKIPGSRFHNGGRIKFGPDGKLYITTGDAQVPDLSQDLDSLAGKILRINPDGSIPDDNPIENSMVYALGLRNPQGLSWHPITGDLYASDHGPNSQDEINKILPGENYGWPRVTCTSSDDRFKDPISCYSSYTLAPSGITFLPWENTIDNPLYVAGLRGNMVLKIDIDTQGDLIKQEPIINDYGRIRTIIYFRGSFYIATNNRDGRGTPSDNDDLIIKVTPNLPTQ